MKRLLLSLVFLVTGCATTGEGDPRDPFEGLNRGVYRFNETFDNIVARPAATAYRDFVPRGVRDRVRNFFSNLSDPLIAINNLLQGKVNEALDDGWRFILNTTVGLAGIHDVATDLGLEKHNEDFGQTFGRWGADPGPYLVLPILGSSTLRDGIGLAADWYADPLGEIRPINLRNTVVVVRGVQIRADLLEAGRLLEEAALDKYVFQRDAYLQRRRSLVYDGRPPRERFD
ncbi:MAG TPA: VacJ family lipoprotein [Burkholderiales bacterium]|nr:VacJ family lipoprotein [Burkholderiales bacterium]